MEGIVPEIGMFFYKYHFWMNLFENKALPCIR